MTLIPLWVFVTCPRGELYLYPTSVLRSDTLSVIKNALGISANDSYDVGNKGHDCPELILGYDFSNGPFLRAVTEKTTITITAVVGLYVQLSKEKKIV